MQVNITTAINHINRGEFTSALDVLKTLSNLQAKNPQLWHLRATAERKLGLFKASEKHFLKALKLAPNQAEIINAYGNLLKQVDQVELAKIKFKKAINCNPNYIDPHINLANILFSENNYNQAKAYFKSALIINRNNLSAKVGLAKCLNKTEQEIEAKNILVAVLKDQPNHEQSLYLLGQIEKDDGNIEAAKKLFNAISAQSNVIIQASKALASCYLIEDKVDTSINIYEKVINNSPLDYDAHHQLSLIKWSKSLPINECFSNYETAIKRTNSTLLMGEYGRKLLHAKEYNKAIEVADNVLSESKNDPIAYIIKSNSLRELGEFEEAVSVSTQGIKYNKNHLGLIYEQGHAFIANDNAVASLKIFDRLARNDQNGLSCIALKSTSLKMLGETAAYNELCDPNKFIYCSEISSPNNDWSLAEFNEKLNVELTQLHTSKQQPLDQSLINGTQTIGDLFPSKSEYINMLDTHLQRQIKYYIEGFSKHKKHPFLKRLNTSFQYQGSWSVLLQKQGFHKHHYHSEGWISGPYYNQIPSAVNFSGEGWIEFGVPGFNMKTKLEADYIVKPQSGLLVLFPSYFWHGTRPFTSDETRMTISFDVVPS